MRAALAEPDSDDPTITTGDAVVAALIRLAKEGDIAALKLLIERSDGPAEKPLDPVLEEIVAGMFSHDESSMGE